MQLVTLFELNKACVQAADKEDLHHKLQHCGNFILEWAKTEVGNTHRKIEQLSREIDNFYTNEELADGEDIIRSKEKDLEKLLIQEEVHWQQRSRK